MAGFFLGLESPHSLLNLLKKFHRPVEGVEWYGSGAFTLVGWDEWGLLPLCDLQGPEEKAEALDLLLQRETISAFTISMSKLTFWVAESVTDICLRIEPSDALESLMDVCLRAAAEAGMAASAFEPLICLGQARDVPREALEAYARDVEPIAPVTARLDKLLLCRRLYHSLTDIRTVAVQPDRHVLFEYALQAG